MVRVLAMVTAFARHDGDLITPWLGETIRRLRTHDIDVEVLAPSYRGLPSGRVQDVMVHRFRYAPAALETLTHDQTAPDRIRERPHFLALVPGYVAAGATAAARLATLGRYHVLHAFWPLPHGLWGLAAKRLSGLPLVCTFFGVELLWMERQLRFLQPVLRRIVRGSDRVTAISRHTAEALSRHCPHVHPTIIPFGAAADPADAPTASWPATGTTELLFIGRLVERKGVHVLLQAMTRVPAQVRLNVVGDGPQRPLLERQVAALGLQSRVVFHGCVDQEEKARWLRACHVLVLPAVVDAKGDTEGLGVVLLEAMVFGKPVIASRAGGIVDIVRHGENGWLVPPGDPVALARAVVACAENPERAQRMGHTGRLDVEQDFSWGTITSRLASLYRELATSPVRMTD